MTRHVIGREGVVEMGTLIEPGAIKMPKEPIPVTTGFGGRIVGKAFGLQRDDSTGELSVEVILSGEFSLDDDDFEYSFSAANVDGSNDGAQPEITAGDLLEVAIVPTPVEAVVSASEDTQAPPA